MEASARATVQCAFCRGKGKDPFGILSYLSTCCICGGKRTNQVRQPYVECVFCAGSGVYPHSRLTCTACGAVGVRSVADQTVTCPKCLGDGVEPASGTSFYCWTCHGAGVVEGVG